MLISIQSFILNYIIGFMLEMWVHAPYFHEDNKCLGHTNHHRYFLEKISIRHRELMTILVIKYILCCRKSKDCTVV